MNVNISEPEVNVKVSAPKVTAETGTPVAREWVEREAYAGPYTVTPSESAQTLETEGKRMTDDVEISAISSSYVGSGITRRSSTDLSASGGTVTAPAGYYSAAASKSVQSGTEGTPSASKSAVSNHAVTVTPSVTNTEGYISGGTHTGTSVQVTAAELESGTKQITSNGEGIDVGGYAEVDVAVSDSVFVVTIVWDDDEEMWAPDKTYEEIYEAYSNQTQIEVVPDPSYSYVIGEQLVQGHYEPRLDSFMYTVFNGTTETTYLYNEDSDITVLNSRDLYDTSGATITGNGQLLSGVKAVGADGTVYTGNIPSKSSPDLTASGATVTVPAGHYASQASKAVASGTAGTPTAAKGAVSNHAVTVTPSVTNTEGYISGGTKTGAAVTVYASELVSGTLYCDEADTWNVTNAENFVVGAGTEGTPTATKSAVSNHSVSVTPSVTNTRGWITGSTKTGTAVQVTAAELESGTKSITQNGTGIDVTGYSAVDVAVPSGGSKNTQVVQGTTRTNASTLTAIGAELTVSKTGTYDVYYTCFRTNTSTSYTWGTRLYIDGTAQGTENTTWTNNQQNVHLTNVSLTVGQKLRVYGRETRGTSYYVCAPMLAIVEA